jgi:hypothetical protein
MAIVQSLIFSLLFALCGGGLLLGLPLLLGQRDEKYPQWLISLALALGFALGFGRLFEIWAPPFPPVDSTTWIFYLLPLGAFWGGFQASKTPPHWLNFAMRLGLSGLSQALVLSPLRESAGPQSWLIWSAGLALLTTVLWTGLDVQAQADGSVWQILTGTGVAAALGALLMLGHSVVLSQQALILAGLLALVFLLGLLQKREHWQGVWSVPLLGLALLASGGRFFADLSPAVLLLVPALLTPLLSNSPWLAEKPLWLKRGLPLLLSILLCGLAVGGVFLSQPPDTSGGY